MGTVFPSNSINNALTKAKAMGVDTASFLANVSYTQTTPNAYIYSSLFQENTQLARQLVQQHTGNTTNDKKARYEEELVRGVQWLKGYMIWWYYGLAVLFLIVGFMKNFIPGLFPLLVLAVFLYFYPIIALWVEQTVLKIWRWIIAMVFAVPYVPVPQLFVFQRPMAYDSAF
jgi:hypothetical protein